MESKLIAQQGYLFIYFFLILIIAISTINILKKYIIKEKSFVIITVVTLLVFYILAFDIFYNPIEFFIKLSLPSTTITGMIFFMMLSFGYGLYSLGILYFKDSMPINHILIFLFVGVFYSVGFIHYYCMPLF
ncbi:MAG: hypothetical protein GXO60_03030 [Epsilonproteobacteria bacterium]|nr:hypothetical protein [Campylobacterota bacterium]